MSTASALTRAVRVSRRFCVRHPGFVLVLSLHAVVYAAVVGRGSPWATVAMDCITGTVPEIALSEPAWSMWEMSDGLVGGLVLAGLAGLPVFAVLGVGSGVGKVLAWLTSVLVLSLVYRVLVRAAPPAWAALGTAGVAFAPPVVFHTSMIYGNWHWTELIFDYGAAALALHLAWPRVAEKGPAGQRGIVLLGAVCGLALFNSPQSLPFVLLACGAAALGLGRRRSLRSLPFLCLGGLVGLAPLLWRLRLQVASVAEDSGLGDPIWTRIFQFRPEWDKAWDLFGARLPWTLHVRDALPGLSLERGYSLEVAWVLFCWIGCVLALLALLLGVLRLRRGEGDPGALAASALPLSFCLAFAMAYLVIDTRIEILPADFSNIREHTHIMLPPLLVGMVAVAPVGWWGLWRFAGSLGYRPASLGLQAVAVLAALVPAGIGLLAQASIAAQAPGPDAGGLLAYRTSCFDLPGFFHSTRAGGPAEAERHCGELSTPARRRDCLAGVAWGVGFHSGALEGSKPDHRDPCSRIPPDLRKRCRAWGADEIPNLTGGVEAACQQLGEDRRDLCLMGAGWFVSQVVWGQPSWPIGACETLATEDDQAACWRGPGFHAADHLHPTPQRLKKQIERAPGGRQGALARGAGYLLGRTYNSEELARGICTELGESLAVDCWDGVDDARAHSVER